MSGRLTTVLTALFFAAVAILALGQARQGSEGRRPDGPRAPRLGPSDAEKERARLRIGITKEQQQQLESILEETGKQTRAVYDQLREKHKQLQALYDEYEIDRAKERTVIREIARLRLRLLQIHSEHETKVRQVLNKEQHARLRALMKEAMESAQRRWRERFPPPPPGTDKRHPGP